MNAIEAVMARMWAITPEYLQIIMKIANRETNIDALLKKSGERVKNASNLVKRGNVAVLTVAGPIMKYANFFTYFSGATSLQTLMKDFNTALNDPAIETIILELDSPGGDVNGVNEFANAVFAARSRKKIVTYVGGMAASAGYWIGSASSDIVIDKTALLGSIGVVATYIDNKERLEKNGVKEIEIVSGTSPKKRPDIHSDDGRELIQQRVDDIQAIFVATVARNRGVSEEKVLSDFGQGDVFVGQRAIDAGMANRLGSLESLIEEFNQKSNKKEIFTMSEKVKTYTAEQITPDFLQANFPDVFKSISEGAKMAERQRIKGIYDRKRPGVEKIIESGMFESDKKPGDVAMEILDHENTVAANQKAAIDADAAEVPALGAASPAEDVSAEKAESEKVDAAIRRGIEKQQRA